MVGLARYETRSLGIQTNIQMITTNEQLEEHMDYQRSLKLLSTPLAEVVKQNAELIKEIRELKEEIKCKNSTSDSEISAEQVDSITA